MYLHNDAYRSYPSIHIMDPEHGVFSSVSLGSNLTADTPAGVHRVPTAKQAFRSFTHGIERERVNRDTCARPFYNLRGIILSAIH